MPIRRRKNDNLHGNVPDSSPVALILIDVINDLDFPQNAFLLTQMPALSRNIAALAKRCRESRIPVIYVNDNRGKWRSDFRFVIAHCKRPGMPGAPFVEKLVPEPGDYLVLKPKHSAFYATPLDTLLAYLKTKIVILAGLTTAACVLLTAGEIYVRDLELFVPADCVAALRETDHRRALAIMRTSFRADTRLSKKLDLKTLLRK